MNQEPPEKRFSWQETAQQAVEAFAAGAGAGVGAAVATGVPKAIKAVASKLGHDPKPSEKQPEE